MAWRKEKRDDEMAPRKGAALSLAKGEVWMVFD